MRNADSWNQPLDERPFVENTAATPGLTEMLYEVEGEITRHRPRKDALPRTSPNTLPPRMRPPRLSTSPAGPRRAGTVAGAVSHEPSS